MSRKAKVYAVVNRKGGVGKTTTAVTVAHGLARLLEQKGGRVLLVDLDPQGNVATSLGLKANGADLAYLLLGQKPIEQSVIHADRSKSDGPHRPNLWIIPTSDALADARVQLIMAGVASQFSRSVAAPPPADQLLTVRLAKAVATFDYIILDCPPSLDALDKAVYQFADSAIVPVKVDYLGMAGAARHTRDLIAMQAEGIKIKISLIVPTFVRPREILARQMMDALINAYGEARVGPAVPQAVAVEQAPAAGGQTLFEYAPDSPATKAYEQIVERIYHG